MLAVLLVVEGIVKTKLLQQLNLQPTSRVGEAQEGRMWTWLNDLAICCLEWRMLGLAVLLVVEGIVRTKLLQQLNL